MGVAAAGCAGTVGGAVGAARVFAQTFSASKSQLFSWQLAFILRSSSQKVAAGCRMRWSLGRRRGCCTGATSSRAHLAATRRRRRMCTSTAKSTSRSPTGRAGAPLLSSAALCSSCPARQQQQHVGVRSAGSGLVASVWSSALQFSAMLRVQILTTTPLCLSMQVLQRHPLGRKI